MERRLGHNRYFSTIEKRQIGTDLDQRHRDICGNDEPEARRVAELAQPTEYCSISVCIFRVEECEWRQRQNFDVQGQRPVLDVLKVTLDPALDLFRSIGLAPPAVDLGPAGDAGLDLVAGEIAVDH